MTQFSIGEKILDFIFQTPFDTKSTLYDTSQGKKILLLFLRFMGCRLTQLEIRRLIQHYDQIISQDTRAFVVVQSPPATVREYYNHNDLPFTIICDPEKKLYQQFSVLPAETEEVMKSGGYNAKIEQINLTEPDLVRGKAEGDPLQLPAVFLTDESLVLKYIYYGKNASDIPLTAEIVGLLSQMDAKK